MNANARRPWGIVAAALAALVASSAACSTTTCEEQRGLAVSGACTLADAKANTPLSVQVLQPCASGVPTCNVTVRGTTIDLSLDGEVCTSSRSGSAAEPAACVAGARPCAVPPLAAGSYTLRVNGRTAPLTVSAAGTQVGCDLAKKPTFSQYRTSCAVDTDCQAVALLDYPADPANCPACACANTAIAKSDGAKFEEETRAARSHCLVATPTRQECGALCTNPEAFCDAGTCALRK